MRRSNAKRLSESRSQRPIDREIVTDIRSLIDETRRAVATTVSSGLTILY